MNKGVVGGLIVAGLAGIAGYAIYKKQNYSGEVSGGAYIGGGYSGGGIPDLSPFLPGGENPVNPLSPVVLPEYPTPAAEPTVSSVNDIMKLMTTTMQPSDEKADNVQAQTLANALTETNLASSNIVYNHLLSTADNYKNDDGTYTGFGYTYMDLNQFKGALAQQAAIQSIGADAYNAMSGGQRSVLLSAIKNGKANTVDRSAVSEKDLLPNGNITNETFDKLLSDTLAGTTPTPTPTQTPTSSGGTTSSTAAAAAAAAEKVKNQTAAEDKTYSSSKSSSSQKASQSAKSSGTGRTYSGTTSSGGSSTGTGTYNTRPH